MFKNIILLIIKGLYSRPLRSWLTIVWIILWIMLVVIITSLWNWIQNVIRKQLQMFWSDLVVIFPWKESNPFVWLIWWQKFKEKDLKNLEKIDWIKYVIPREIWTINIDFKWESKVMLIHASSWKNLVSTFKESQWLKLEKWSWPDSDHKNEIVLWKVACSQSFKNKINIWDEVKIKSKKFVIRWCISSLWSQTDDNIVYISMEKYSEITWTYWKARSALIKIKPGFSIDLISRKIRIELEKQENVEEFSIITPQKVWKIIWDTLKTVELFLVFIALISLIVWWVWITNTMYMSVFERTKQIWVMKAIWANNDIILSLFIIESWIIWIIWWVLWIIFWLIISFFIWFIASNYWIDWLFSVESIDYFTLFVILIVTFITWVLSWILPAKKASNLEPAEALRYE